MMIRFNAETELTITIEILTENCTEKDIAQGLDNGCYQVVFGKSTYSDLGTIVDDENKILATVKTISAHRSGEYYEFERT
jgi:hypothetical protein